MALKALQHYTEFKGFKITVPEIRVYDNSEMFVPNPDMIRRLVYGIRNLGLRAGILLASETGASASEVLGVTWKDVNLVTRTVTIIGVKGHRTTNYQISEELATLFSQQSRDKDSVFMHKTADGVSDSLRDYVQRLAGETANRSIAV